MLTIKEILAFTSHRPFAIPSGNWAYYQEWNKALFLHWAVPYDILKKCVPEKLKLDTFDNKCYVSVVAFSMEKIRPRYLPAFSFISDFAEINFRTYIDNDDKKGVYFLSIEAEKILSTYIAKWLSGLPYEKAEMFRTDHQFISKNIHKNFSLETEFEIKEKIENKSSLDLWLTERYCLYFDLDNLFYRYDIHHKEWDLFNVNLKNLQVDYKIVDIHVSGNPELMHYSDGVKVLAWDKVKL